ncbi:sulfite exporter TauE/SafE family protein [Sphingomonas oligophenolica]|uniref:Probable membrane transporter protein n=1 Tax=Sphingomonas oligophenolica TaxID=301154 RepID=A0A502CSG5_9SPHN|nr:sulfite exporter TauE/SafE family protein [Sphingomonas oligophenolica]TPG15624.1 sulfite exporter TauE/SafE family protein [Sphingomonas oligophenolica]
MTIEPLYSVAGALVGVLVGLTGVGGGSLMTPLLVLAFGFHPATAVGTDLLFASATKTVGTSVHGWRGTVDWRVVRRLAAGSIPAAVLMLIALALLGERSKQTAAVISVVLGVMLILTAVATLFRARLLGWLTPRFGTLEGRALLIATVMLGAVLGALVSLTSVGAGALGITALLVLYPKLPIARLVGSDIAHAVPLTLVAGAGHLLLGSVNVALLVSLLAGSIPGVIVGSLISSRVNERVLAVMLATVLVVVGVKMLL